MEDFALTSLSAASVLEALQTGKSPNLRLELLPAVVKEAEVVVMATNPLDSVVPENPLNAEPGWLLWLQRAGQLRPGSFRPVPDHSKAIWGEVFRLRAGLLAELGYEPVQPPDE